MILIKEEKVEKVSCMVAEPEPQTSSFHTSTRFYLGSWHTDGSNGDSFFLSLFCHTEDLGQCNLLFLAHLFSWQITTQSVPDHHTEVFLYYLFQTEREK